MPDLSEIPEEYHQLINDLIPAVAIVVDKYGGLCRMDNVCCDKTVRDIRAKFPPREKAYRMQQLLSQEAEFFTLIDDNDKIATATGYENNLLTPEGKVTPEGEKHLQDLKDQAREQKHASNATNARAVPKASQASSGKGNAAPGKGKGKGAVVSAKAGFSGVATVAQKRQMAQRLYDAMLTASDADFDAVVRDARRMRGKAGSVPTPAPTVRGRVAGVTTRMAQTKPRVMISRDRPQVAKTNLKRPREEPREPREDRPEVEMVKPNTTPAQLKDLERMMRLCVNMIKAAPDNTLVLSKLAGDDEVKKLKPSLNGAPFKGLFETCYPAHFSLDKLDSNQMTVTMLKEPKGANPPLDVPLVRSDLDLQRPKIRRRR